MDQRAQLVIYSGFVLPQGASHGPSKDGQAKLCFRMIGQPRRAPPFAHLLGPSSTRLPPLARMASAGGGKARGAAAGADDSKFQRWAEAMAEEELGGRGGGESRRHDNQWYQDRCVFCAACRGAIDSEHGRRGSRCAGCRRWFHGRCRPDLKAPGRAGESAAAGAGGGGGGSNGGGAGSGGGGGGSSGGGKGAYFHCDECRRTYDALRRAAARGRRQLPAPPAPGGLFGGLFGGRSATAAAAAAEEEPLTLRLIDLSEVKPQYKNLQQSGMLWPRRRHLLQQAGLLPAPAAGKAPAAASEAASDDSDASGSEAGLGSAKRAALAAGGGRSAVDDFILASELLTSHYKDDTPKDVLEDSFGVLLARGGAPVCAATVNLYAPDHARIQSIVSAEGQRRKGHAALLVSELHGILADAGLARVVAVVAEDTDEAHAARDRLLQRRFGYKPLPIETLVEWRAEIPEYHKSLVGGHALLERPLQAPRAR